METHEDRAPTNVPPNGFYYHYKHTSSGDPYNYMYEVVGTAFHTELENQLVLYRPLYGDRAYLAGADFGARPLTMWNEQVEVNGEVVPRFTHITDDELIQKLEVRRKDIYGA